MWELRESIVATIKSAVWKLTGFLRRQFRAEVAIQYCDGWARRAEALFACSECGTVRLSDGRGRFMVDVSLTHLRGMSVNRVSRADW